MDFIEVIDRARVGHWALQRGTDRDSGREYARMACLACRHRTTPWPLEDAVPPENHWSAGNEMRAHDEMWHPELVAEQDAANCEILLALRGN